MTLYNHEQTSIEDTLSAYAERSDLDASHERQEIEIELVGAYLYGEFPQPMCFQAG